jgi:hypothetical protein
MCTATIVVSLPTLKPLIMRVSPVNTSNRSNGYYNVCSRKSVGHPGAARSHAHAGRSGDDEVELVFRELSRKSSTSGQGALDMKDGVRVTTDVTVTRDVL